MKSLSKTKKITIALVMGAALAVPVAIAQSTDQGAAKVERREGRRGKGMREGRGGGFLRGIELSDAQKTQFRQLRQSQRQAIRPLMEQIRARRQEIRAASQGASFDQALVAQKLAEIAPLEAKVMAEEFRFRQETLSLLTPEQRTRFEQSGEQKKGSAFAAPRR